MDISELKIKVKVDTTEIDEALKKIKEVAEIISNLNSSKEITIKCNEKTDIEQLVKELEFYRKKHNNIHIL